MSNDQSEEVQQVCLAEELSSILKSTYIDINLKIALILARQHGWPIDFVYTHWTTKFILVVTVDPVEDDPIQPIIVEQPYSVPEKKAVPVEKVYQKLEIK